MPPPQISQRENHRTEVRVLRLRHRHPQIKPQPLQRRQTNPLIIIVRLPISPEESLPITIFTQAHTQVRQLLQPTLLLSSGQPHRVRNDRRRLQRSKQQSRGYQQVLRVQ